MKKAIKTIWEFSKRVSMIIWALFKMVSVAVAFALLLVFFPIIADYFNEHNATHGYTIAFVLFIVGNVWLIYLYVKATVSFKNAL